MPALINGQLGVGLIGAGAAGRQHLAAIRVCPQVHAVGVVDIDSDAAARLASEQRDPHRVIPFADLDQMLDDERVAIVAIATPPGNHRELAQRVLSAGRAILLEKPPLLTSLDLDIVIAHADAMGLAAGVMLQHRFRLGPDMTAHAWTDQALASVEVVRHRPAEHYSRAGWRTDAASSGGGLLAHLGVHYLDLACQLLGEPEVLDADIGELAGTSIDQRIVLRARFRSGAGLAFVGSTALQSFAERLAVYDVDRQLVIEPKSTIYSAAGVEEIATAPATPELRARVYADVATAVRERRDPRVADLRSARGVIRLLELTRETTAEQVPA
jgi:predicted dehydrogenase